METLQPKLRFPEFKGDWEYKLINEILSIGSGRDYKHLEKGNVPVYGTGGLMTYVNDFLYDGETVCIGRKGTIDKPMYFQGKLWTVDTLFYTNKFINSSPKFIYNLFQRINWKEYNQASGVPSLSKSTIEKINIIIPSLEEQTKIANFLSSVDEKLQLLKEKKALLEEYKKGVMQQLFNQEIRFKDDKGEDFGEWEEKQIKDIFKVTRGTVLSMLMVKENIENDYKYPVYSSQTKQKGLAGYYNSFLFENAITWTTDGAGAGDVKYRKGKFYCTNVCGVLLNENGYCNLFIAELINSISRKYVSYVGNPKLMNNVMSEIMIYIPSSIKEQTKIANFLSAIDEKIALVSNQIQDTQEYKKGLLQQMFC